LELVEVSVLASRAAFLSLTSWQYQLSRRHVSDMLRSYDELLPLWAKRKEDVRPARA
jgi:hypothetical protein